jgi:phosphoenolpyruvate carboxykinase (GTP)
MAMLPFIGYHAGDYLRHWLELGKRAAGSPGEDGLPKIFYVNWFRRGDDGRFLWPGFGENSRVLKWVVERLDGTAGAQETPVGRVPSVADLDLDGLDTPRADVAEALRVDVDEWRAEVPQIAAWFASFGAKLPATLAAELDALKLRLGVVDRA